MAVIGNMHPKKSKQRAGVQSTFAINIHNSELRSALDFNVRDST